MNDKRFEEGLEEQSEKALMESESGIEAQKAETQAAAEEEEKPEKNGPGQEAEIAEPPGKKHKIFKIVLLVIILTAVAVGIGVYVGYANYYSGRFFEGTVINQIDCSGLTVEQVEDILAEKVEDYSIELTFRGDARETLEGEAIGYEYVSDGSVQAIKDGQKSWKWIKGYFIKSNEQATVQTRYDEEKLQQQLYSLPELQEGNMTPPTDAYVDYLDGRFQVVAETYGNTLDKDLVLEAVKQAVGSSQRELNAEEIGNAYAAPALRQEDAGLNQQAAQLNELVSASITYELPTGSQTLDGNIMKDWLMRDEAGNYVRDEDTWNQHIAQYVADMAAAVDTVGTDRQFQSTGLGEITVGGGVYGWKIDQSSEIRQLTEELANRTVTTREPVYKSREVTTENNGFGYTYVEIDLSRQHLWLYLDGKLTVESDIVSGKMTKKRYTPAGIFRMYYKQRDKVLRGEKKADGTYEYETPVEFWMPFNGGIGMHDAEWNPYFGGTRYINSGSHGCINLPYRIAQQIYEIMNTDIPIICYYSQPYGFIG